MRKTARPELLSCTLNPQHEALDYVYSLNPKETLMPKILVEACKKPSTLA